MIHYFCIYKVVKVDESTDLEFVVYQENEKRPRKFITIPLINESFQNILWENVVHKINSELFMHLIHY